MNILKTWEDGSYMPVWQEDLKFIQNASTEVIGALCKALFGRDYGVLWGCDVVVQNSKTSVGEGCVFVGNEIIHVPAQMILGDYPAPTLQKEEVFDSLGDKIFKVNGNAETRQTYLTPYMKLKGGIIHGPSKITLYDEDKKTLLQRIYDVFGAMPYEITAHSANGVGNSHAIKYAKIGRQVFILSLTGITGGMDPGSGEAHTNSTVYTLPEGFRPSVETFFTYKINTTNDNSKIRIGSVTTDGKIQINAYVSITAVAFNFLTPSI